MGEGASFRPVDGAKVSPISPSQLIEAAALGASSRPAKGAKVRAVKKLRLFMAAPPLGVGMCQSTASETGQD
ncbi:hypothetical protein OSCI_3720005 [Kamptonema sp. PCC 6506]|nr:hypothetical protein OSCI_3720005 [Kamptonema sp. PCC 6506]